MSNINLGNNKFTRLCGPCEQSRLARWLVVVLFCLLCGSCGPSQIPVLDEIKQKNELVVLTLNSPTTYYEERETLAGMDYHLAMSFKDYLDVNVRFVVKDNIAEIFSALEKGQGHIAAAGLTKTSQRTEKYLAGPAYQAITQQVVCHRSGAKPKDITGLIGLKLAVVAGSSYAELLTHLRSQHPELVWREEQEATSESMLEQVWQKKIDCTVADSNIVAVNRRYYPELEVAFDITEPESLVWYMQADAQKLAQITKKWFDSLKSSGKHAELLERYYGFIDNFDYVDAKTFERRTKERLPKYQAWFKTAAEQHNLPWTLLAAQSYVESHWNPRAKSPTGVRGIMMLTQPTAKEVGVSNRLDAESNIFGGAEYLAKLKKRIDEAITDPDRTWLALAAYNVGMGHLRDAQSLAKQLGKNSRQWADLKTVLPLLSQKKHYKKLKHGYARGGEPVSYVDRIRDFEQTLIQLITLDPNLK